MAPTDAPIDGEPPPNELAAGRSGRRLDRRAAAGRPAADPGHADDGAASAARAARPDDRPRRAGPDRRLRGPRPRRRLLAGRPVRRPDHRSDEPARHRGRPERRPRLDRRPRRQGSRLERPRQDDRPAIPGLQQRRLQRGAGLCLAAVRHRRPRALVQRRADGRLERQPDQRRAPQVRARPVRPAEAHPEPLDQAPAGGGRRARLRSRRGRDARSADRRGPRDGVDADLRQRRGREPRDGGEGLRRPPGRQDPAAPEPGHAGPATSRARCSRS